MPVARYFLFVGGALLALLLAINVFVPQEQEAVVASPAVSSMDKTVVRIRSDQKLPERVVYDTSLPTIVPSPTVTAQAPAPPVRAATPVSADASAQARVRETFAQFVPEAKPQVQHKRKVARSRPAAPMLFAQPRQMPMQFGQFGQPRQVRVAQQQSHFGFFGGPSWNSTW